MEVKGPGSVQRSFPIGSTKPAAAPAKASTSKLESPKDAVEISSAGQLLDKMTKSEIRAERLAQIKAQIAAGEYETEEKLEAALMNLFSSMIGNERHD